MYMQEAGIEVPLEQIDILKGENRQSDYLGKNATGTSPALELDDGSIVSEIIAICEYLDEKNGSSALIGTTPEERAESRMWCRRIDLNVLEPLTNGFRYSEGLPMFKDRIPTAPEAADGLKRIAQERITWLDGQLEGKQFVCGDRFTLADILLFVFLEFGGQIGQPLNEANKNVMSHYQRVGSRSSASA